MHVDKLDRFLDATSWVSEKVRVINTRLMNECLIVKWIWKLLNSTQEK